MKKFIVKSENDELTANHIIDTLENEFDIIATVKEVNPIDEEKLEELAEKCYEPIMPINDWIDVFKICYRKAKEE